MLPKMGSAIGSGAKFQLHTRCRESSVPIPQYDVAVFNFETYLHQSPSGLVDSFALVEVLLEVEKLTGRRIPAGRVSPPDMDTVREMLAVAEMVGTVRP